MNKLTVEETLNLLQTHPTVWLEELAQRAMVGDEISDGPVPSAAVLATLIRPSVFILVPTPCLNCGEIHID